MLDKLVQEMTIKIPDTSVTAQFILYANNFVFRQANKDLVDEKRMRRAQVNMECTYTTHLAEARARYSDALSSSLTVSFAPFLKNKSSVVEFGPGREGFLHRMLGDLSAGREIWYGLDISRKVYDGLNMNMKGTNFIPLLGEAHVKHKALKKGTVDAAVFCCSHDSMMEFKQIADTCSYYLKPYGQVILLQDLFPSKATISSLVSRDSRFDRNIVTLVNNVRKGRTDFAYVGVPVSEKAYDVAETVRFIDIRPYLHERVADQFCRR
ncbi:MAG: hypothetical protein HGA85_09415, partial [Nanoarchaeota archaeon]|nr:hypothetical protein [Nanoarchaeota archaeon]